MEQPEKFVISLEDENTVASSRPYFDYATLRQAQPVAPLAPGPAIVVPVRSGLDVRALALIAGVALLLGVLGGWALGHYQQPVAAPLAEAVEAQPAPTIAEPTPELVAAPAPQPEIALSSALDDKKDGRTAPKPVLKPAKTKPGESKNATPEATPGKTEEPPHSNGETRPRRATGNNTQAGAERKVAGRDNGDLNHR